MSTRQMYGAKWAILVLALVNLSACAISQRPELTTINQPPPPLPVSEANFGAKISLPGLARHLETLVPAQYRDQGDETESAKIDVCPPFKCWVKTNVCKWSWYAEARRTPFTVRPVNGGLSVTSTVTLWGRVRTRGPICPPLQETTEPNGVMTLTVNVRPSFNEVYGLQPNVSYDPWNWSERPGIKLANFIKVSFGTKAKEAIDKALDDITIKTNQDLTARLDFRNQVERGWAQMHEPISLSPDQTMWASVKPLSLHASPLLSDVETASIFIGLRSKNEAFFGAKPLSQDLVGLPILKPRLPGDQFKLTALARLEYASLLNRIRSEWAGKTLSLDWGRLKFNDFRLYQSGDRLVVGVDVRIMHKSLPYVEGWLYLAGRPVVEDNRLYLRDLDYRANTSNPVVQVLAFLFRDPARRELERKLSFDLAGPLQEVASRLNNIPPRPIGTWGELSLNVERPTVGSPVPDASSLVIPVTLAGKAEAAFFVYKDSTAPKGIAPPP